MNRILQRTLMAYRPLYLNGLLLDGRLRDSLPRRPAPRAPDDPPPAARPRRMLLIALAGLRHHPLFQRSPP